MLIPDGYHVYVMQQRTHSREGWLFILGKVFRGDCPQQIFRILSISDDDLTLTSVSARMRSFYEHQQLQHDVCHARLMTVD